MLDDDTYILQPSLRAVLSQLDPDQALYLGNAVGSFKSRFAHGGSSIILSRAAMARLFGGDSALVQAAYVESLKETWGDKLVATTLMKVGIYLEEGYSSYFNGERPRITRIRADRFCSPIVSFHGLADPEQIKNVANLFGRLEHPVVWGRIWSIYGQPDFKNVRLEPIRKGRDHVGREDKPTIGVSGVSSVIGCLNACNKRQKTCLAWTWDAKSGSCHISPWIIIGDEGLESSYSGVNVARATELMGQCLA